MTNGTPPLTPEGLAGIMAGIVRGDTAPLLRELWVSRYCPPGMIIRNPNDLSVWMVNTKDWDKLLQSLPPAQASISNPFSGVVIRDARRVDP